MGRGEFRRWAEQQEGARYERVNGEPVAIVPECAIHARIKTRVWQALDRELRDHGRGVIHHRRAPDGDIDTRIVSSGRIALDPPGIALDSDEIYGR
jgi:hypothetical protein